MAEPRKYRAEVGLANRRRGPWALRRGHPPGKTNAGGLRRDPTPSSGAYNGLTKTPGRDTVGIVRMAQLRVIAETKMVDLNANDIDSAARMLAGTARSMGVQVME